MINNLDKIKFSEYTIEYKNKLSSYFNCGNIVLDSFLLNNNALDLSFGKTYIYLTDDESKIVGYFNISTDSVYDSKSKFNERLGGSIYINCFAIDKSFQGLVVNNDLNIKLSDIIFCRCLSFIKEIRLSKVGFSFITLSATNEGYHLYKRNGFEELEEDMDFHIDQNDKDCIPMYLALLDI